jgi:predicted signal transduction protein with EAL and GGDEF domain
LALVQAADQALYSAKHAGRAQARLLDLVDVDAPQRARDIAPLSSHKSRAAQRDERIST